MLFIACGLFGRSCMLEAILCSVSRLGKVACEVVIFSDPKPTTAGLIGGSQSGNTVSPCGAKWSPLYMAVSG